MKNKTIVIGLITTAILLSSCTTTQTPANTTATGTATPVTQTTARQNTPALTTTISTSVPGREPGGSSTELLYWDETKAYNGYTLFAAVGRSYLIDMEGKTHIIRKRENLGTMQSFELNPKRN